MKILHVSQYCHAGSIGGTERYLLDMCRGLAALGHEPSILWLGGGPTRAAFVSEGVQVLPLEGTVMRVDEPRASFGPEAAAILDAERPGALHFHTFGLAEARLAEMARQRGIPYLFTYHSPAWTCRRETMLRWGRELCDGEVRAVRCSACKIQERIHLPPSLAVTAALASIPAGQLFSPRSATNLRRRVAFYADSRRYRRALRRFLARCSASFALNEIARSILARNAALPNRLFACPPAIPLDAVRPVPGRDGQPEGVPAGQFVVGYVGRVLWVKGVHLLIEAFQKANLPEAELRIFGWKDDDSDYAATIQQLVAGNPRIRLHQPLPLQKMVAEYGRLTLLAMPSIWLEMGSLVLQEAWQAGLPVCGSARLGQVEELRRRGWVVEPNTASAWAEALRRTHALHAAGGWSAERERARSNGPVRTMQTVAREVADHLDLLARR